MAAHSFIVLIASPAASLISRRPIRPWNRSFFLYEVLRRFLKPATLVPAPSWWQRGLGAPRRWLLTAYRA